MPKLCSGSACTRGAAGFRFEYHFALFFLAKICLLKKRVTPQAGLEPQSRRSKEYCHTIALLKHVQSVSIYLFTYPIDYKLNENKLSSVAPSDPLDSYNNCGRWWVPVSPNFLLGFIFLMKKQLLPQWLCGVLNSYKLVSHCSFWHPMFTNFINFVHECGCRVTTHGSCLMVLEVKF